MQKLAFLRSFIVWRMVFYFQGKYGFKYSMHINSFLLRRRGRQSTTSLRLDSLQHALKLKYSLSSVTSSVWSASILVEEEKQGFHFRIFKGVNHSQNKIKFLLSTKPVLN